MSVEYMTSRRRYKTLKYTEKTDPCG